MDKLTVQADMVYWLEDVELEAAHQCDRAFTPDVKAIAVTLLDFPGNAHVLRKCKQIGRLYAALTEVVTNYALDETAVREKLAAIDGLVDEAWADVDMLPLEILPVGLLGA